MQRTGIAIGLTLFGAAAYACGSEGSEFTDGPDAGGSTTDAGPGFVTGDGAAVDPDGGDSGEACKTADSPATLQPIYLGFAFDVSGSMGQLDCPYWNHDPTVKWRPVVDATVGFFEEAASTNINASLTLFPAASNKCTAATYVKPTVPMTVLPSPAFAVALKSYEREAKLPAGGYTDPMPASGATWRGDTPTRAVVQGVVDFLKPVKTGHPDAKIALVLVTDGLPQGCEADDPIAKVNEVVTAARTSAGIPTYVIGVRDPAKPPTRAPWMEGGNRVWACRDGEGWSADYDKVSTPKPTNPALLNNLNGIAVAGGTKAAVLLDTGDPAATKAAFTAAINSIRANTISCELERPEPPQGETFDPNKVNVRYDSDQKRTPLGFDPECKAANAWRYKGTSNDVIELCPSTCATIRKDPKARVQVEFGCLRRGAVN